MAPTLVLLPKVLRGCSYPPGLGPTRVQCAIWVDGLPCSSVPAVWCLGSDRHLCHLEMNQAFTNIFVKLCSLSVVIPVISSFLGLPVFWSLSEKAEDFVTSPCCILSTAVFTLGPDSTEEGVKKQRWFTPFSGSKLLLLERKSFFPYNIKHLEPLSWLPPARQNCLSAWV